MATSRVNPNFPIPGIDQSSRGFRDNFSTIKTEFENIQNKTIVLVGDVTGNALIDSGGFDVVIDTIISNIIVGPTNQIGNITATDQTLTGLNNEDIILIPPAGYNVTIQGNTVITGTSILGTVSNVTILGGSYGQVLTTNGSGALSWTTISGGGSIGNLTVNNQTIHGTQLSDIFLSPVNGYNVNITSNLVMSGKTSLGTVSNISILGGSTGQVLTTNGNGGLYWTMGSGGSNTLSGLSDVSVTEGPGINGYSLTYSNAHVAWVATPTFLPLYDLTAGVPALSNCVVINGNNAYTVTTSESPGLAINTISSISGNQNLFGYSHTAPMTAPYRVAALLQWTSFGGSNDGNSAVFFGYIDTSGKYSVTLFNNSPQIFAGARYLNSNTLSSTLATYAMESWPELAWFGLRNDGANIHYEMSVDGVNFVSLAQESLGSAFLVNYTNIIWGFQTNNTNPISLTLRCYDPNALTRAFPY